MFWTWPSWFFEPEGILEVEAKFNRMLNKTFSGNLNAALVIFPFDKKILFQRKKTDRLQQS